MPKIYKESEIERQAGKIYSNTIAIQGLRNTLKILRESLRQSRLESQRRKKLPISEQPDTEEEDEITTTKKGKKSKSKLNKKKKRGKGMYKSLCELFKEKGINKVTYQQAKKCATAAKPDSNLSKGHYKWYIKCYKDGKR